MLNANNGALIADSTGANLKIFKVSKLNKAFGSEEALLNGVVRGDTITLASGSGSYIFDVKATSGLVNSAGVECYAILVESTGGSGVLDGIDITLTKTASSATFAYSVVSINYPNADGDLTIDYNFEFNGYPKYVAFAPNDIQGRSANQFFFDPLANSSNFTEFYFQAQITGSANDFRFNVAGGHYYADINSWLYVGEVDTLFEVPVGSADNIASIWNVQVAAVATGATGAQGSPGGATGPTGATGPSWWSYWSHWCSQVFLV